MGTNRTANTAYSLNQPFSQMAPEPIISKRNPTANDTAELGTTWINTATNSVYVITSVVAGAATWTTSPGSGVGTFTSVTINPGDLHLTGTGGDILVDDGNLTITSGDTILGGTLDVTGDAVFTSDVDITGNVTIIGDIDITGDFDISDTGSISLTSTNDAPGAITLDVDGGTSETLLLRSQQGTGASSINITSLAGGVTIQGALATADAINILSGATGGIDMDYGSAGMTVTGANGAFTLASGTGTVSLSSDAAATTVNIGTGAAVVKTISIGGTGANVIAIGNTQTAGSVSVGDAMTSGTITIGGSGAQTGTIALAPGTGAQTVNIATGGTGIKTVNVGTGAVANVVTIGTATGAASLSLLSGSGNMTAASGGTLLLDSAGVLEINSSAGVIGIGNDAVAQDINIGTGAAARIITVGNITTTTGLALNSGTGGIAMVSTGTGDITLASADTVLIDAAGVIEINSSAGVIGIGNDAVAQNINIGTGAGARTITMGNSTSTTSVVIDVGTGALNLGTTGTAHATTVGSTTAGSTLVLNTPTGTDVAAANGLSVTTAGRGLSLPGGVLVLSGAGSPDTAVTAPAGSLYLRTDPAGATSRAYINTDSATAWTNITCAA